MTSHNTGKGDVDDALLEASLRRKGEAGHQYRLSSLRYWDVRISHTKKYMVAGHFVPSIRGAALPFMSKKRRITVELYQPASPEVQWDAQNAAQTKKLFGQLLKGISSSSLMEASALDDHDLDVLRVLKPKQGVETKEDDGDWDGQSVGSMSVSTMGFASSEDDLDFEATNILWKERFRCRLDTVQILNPKGRACDLKLGSDGSAILKTINFESKSDLQTFTSVLDQMNQLRDERGKRLANSYKAMRSKAPKRQGLSAPSPPHSSSEWPHANISFSSTSHDDSALDVPVDVITIANSQDETMIDTAPIHEFEPRTPALAESGDVDNATVDTVQILVEIVAAYNLPIADITASDPYVEVFDGSEEIHRTDTIYCTLNPVWTVNTKSLFLIKTSIEDYFTGSNFISFQIKDYDAIRKNDLLGTVDVSKDVLLHGVGERKVFEILAPAKCASKRKNLNEPATLALRFRIATDQDLLFMESLAENRKRNRHAVYAAETFVPLRDHRVSLMKKTARQGHKPFKEYRVKPFPDPEFKLETTWLTEKEIQIESSKPSKFWIESGTGSLGKVFVEVLQCDKLPNLDFSVSGRDKTDAFACIVYGDCVVHTDVINDTLSPRWMPWSQRAFAFNIMHPSSQLMVGVFDHNSGLTAGGHGFVGRALVNLSNLHTCTLYTQIYALQESSFEGREARGTITLRIRLDIPDARKALVAGAVPVLNNDVSVAEREYFPVVYQTITNGENPTSLNLKSISAYIQELQSYLEILFYLQPALATVLLWRGHYPMRIRVPWPRCRETTEIAGFWDRWSVAVTMHLPLHSVTLFLWGISLARNFNLFPSFLVFAIGWFLLATMEQARKRPSALYQPRSYVELMNMLLFNRSHGPAPITIKSNEDLREIKAYEAQREEIKRAREEIVKTIQMEQKKYQAYIHAETSRLEDDIDITTKVKGGLSPLTLTPLRGIMLPIQQILHAVCVILRVSSSIVVWRDSFVAFWLTTACFVAAFILIWIPWGFIISWTFKIAVWVFLGPWMKFLDFFYVEREFAEEKEQMKEDLAQQFHRRYAMLIGESLARKLRKESALKMKEMKKYMFGQYLMRVPVFKEERFVDDPMPQSFAEPFDICTFGDIRIIDRKYGQLLKGDMIPERQMLVSVHSAENVAGSLSGNPLTTISFASLATEEREPLLLPNPDEYNYGATNTMPSKKAPKR